MQIFHRKGELNKEQKMRMRSLLNMVYTTNELAEHIGFDRRQIYRVYCHMEGHPFVKPEGSRLLEVNGKAFREWYYKTYKKQHVNTDELVCVGCKSVIPLPEKPGSILHKELIDIYKYVCPKCGRTTCRFVSRKNADGEKIHE